MITKKKKSKKQKLTPGQKLFNQHMKTKPELARFLKSLGVV